MKKLFDPDSPIMRFLTQAAELAWLNILWVEKEIEFLHSYAEELGEKEMSSFVKEHQ